MCQWSVVQKHSISSVSSGSAWTPERVPSAAQGQDEDSTDGAVLSPNQPSPALPANEMPADRHPTPGVTPPRAESVPQSV